MKVCITEKPSVAKDIAQILGASTKREGFYEGNGYQITWTFGHLCTLKEPSDYSDRWKSWSLGALPMIPQRFGIKVIDEVGIQRQFKVIETLIGTADEVINCGDAGQEGELIQRWVMQKAKCDKPVMRLWISSLTDESIREGFKMLRPQADFDSLYHAGLSRAIGDWILGMNATRLYTLKYSQNRNILSIGRVQTPTLALIVNRHNEIANFVSEDFWEIKTIYRNTTFNSVKGRYSKEEDALPIIEQIKNAPIEIKSVTTKKGKEAPPRLSDLTTLQVECNKKFSLSAEETLKLIQSLYEKKVTTYPRVDTTYLSDDIYPKIQGILEALRPYKSLTEPVLAAKIAKSKKVFDNSKVTDHHAIIPTNVAPDSVFLTPDEKRVYDMVAKRFIAAFYPDCEFSTTTVEAEANTVEFKATGKQILFNGWRAVYIKDTPTTNEDTETEENDIMPIFAIGESGAHEPSLLKKATQPPKYYTEGTLLRAMETAGKLVEDDELRDAMKENGIGRPSTRAAIIETLFKRKYIKKERKNLIATSTGIELIETINEELLKSAKLTGMWENKLRRIERKEYDAASFISELKALMNEIVMNVLSDNTQRNITVTEEIIVEKPKKKKSAPRKVISSLKEIKCPSCGKGYIIKGHSAFGCSNYKSGCTLILPFESYPENSTPAELSKLIKNKK